MTTEEKLKEMLGDYYEMGVPGSPNAAILQNMLGANNELRDPQSENEALLKLIYEDVIGAVYDARDEAQAAAEAAGTAAEAVANKAPAITDTASGSIASFPDGADGMPVKSLVVNVEPNQDLHGYDSPWPGGGGKNLLEPIQAVGTTVFFNKILFKANTTYCFSIETAPLVSSSLSIYDETKTTQLAYEAGLNKVTYTPTEDTYGYPRLFISGGVPQATVDTAMLEIGSDRTTFAPYSNLCPITGWTGANLSRTGFNVWDEEWEVGNYNITTGQKGTDTNRIRCKNLIPIKGGKLYYIAGGRISFLEYDANGEFLRVGNNGSYIGPDDVITPSADAYYITFQCATTYGTTYNHDISINYPSTDTSYHAYDGTTIPITWADEAGTVYGGTVDVTNGVLTVTHAYKDMGELEWSRNVTNLSGEYYMKSTDLASVIRHAASNNTAVDYILCSNYKPISLSAAYERNTGIAISTTGTVAVYDQTYASGTADAFKAAMNGVQLVYELATPQSFTVTTEQLLTSLYGQNNIFADCGDTSVTYRADTKLYIKRLTGPTDDDMTADSNIPNNTYFLVGNTLYKSTAAIAAGATIAPGTNCTKTDLAAALNALQ